MPEKGPGIDFNSYESKITIGKVEKSVEQKIKDTAAKILESGILDTSGTERETKFGEIIKSIGGFKSYEDMVDATCDDTNPGPQKNGIETFDVLRKSISIAMSSIDEPELQARLYNGGLSEVLPKSSEYNNKGTSKLDLVKGVLEVTITDQNILNEVRILDKARKNLPEEHQRGILIKIADKELDKLTDLWSSVPQEKTDELITVLACVSTEVAVLKSIFKVGDGSVDQNGVVTRSDSVDHEDVKAVIGGLADALTKNTEATQGNTEATQGNTEAVLDLNKALEGYTTAIQTSAQMEILAKLKSQGLVDESAQLSAELMKTLEMEVDNPSLYEIMEGDDEDTKTDKLLRKQKARQQAMNMKLVAGINLLKEDAANGKKWPPNKEIPGNRETWEGDIGELYDWLDSIEKGTRSVDDLSTNSTKFGYLYRAQNGDYDEYLKGRVYNGKEMTEENLTIFKQEISMRLYLHSLNLAASKCGSIEDIMRVVSSMHEGDIDDSLDKLLLSTFLNKEKKGTGLENIPVDKAWNLRQDGYFKIEKILNLCSKEEDPDGNKKIIKNGGIYEEFIRTDSDFKKYLQGLEGGSFYQKLIDYKDEKNKKVLGIKGLLELEEEIPKNEKYGISEPVYQNWFGYEKSGSLKSQLIKEYMVWQLMEGKIENENKAKKAFDLAHKLSVATFMDSAANLAFAQDDYAEIINFKFLRYCDGPGGKENRRSKNKPVGHPDTISYVNSLTCHWMYLLRKDGEPMTTTYSPLYTDSIDLTKYKATTATPYHFFGVVGSQVEFVKDAFFNKFTPKDILTPNFINKIFAKINKTTYDMCRAKIEPIHAQDRSFYKDSNLEARVSEKMRKAWVMNVFRMASIPTSGWTMKDIDEFIRGLRYTSTLIDNYKSGKGSGFISDKELDSAIEVTKVRKLVTRLDDNRYYQKHRP